MLPELAFLFFEKAEWEARMGPADARKEECDEVCDESDDFGVFGRSLRHLLGQSRHRP